MPKEREIDIPELARRCWQQYQERFEDILKEEKESLGFWVGGKHQWRPSEIANREASQRPWITINRCKPAVDQVENEARNNPPGPQAEPVGSGTDPNLAAISEGMIREYEYRSNAHESYYLTIRYAAAAGRGGFKLETEYVSPRSMQQRIVVKPIHDIAACFFDTEAKMPAREDAMWAGEVMVLDRDSYVEQFGNKRKVLDASKLSGAVGWLQEASGWKGNAATINKWTGGMTREGPFFVCNFYRVELKEETLTIHEDGIGRFKDDPNPNNSAPKMQGEEPVTRRERTRKVKKYVVDALETLDETEWYGDVIPMFWAMGPEIYRDGKLERLSLLTGAQAPQRGLNFTATAGLQIVGGMTLAPWVGAQGFMDIQNAQGQSPWASSNMQMVAGLEYKPVWVVNPVTKVPEMAPAPQRNTWEAPIARLMEFATFWGEQIKASTSIFFDPSQQSVRDVQSGAAIKALQAQTNTGTLNWQQALHYAVQLSYQQAWKVIQKITPGQQFIAVVRPDTKHVLEEINREFPADTHERMTNGNFKHRQNGKIEKANNIETAQLAIRLKAGPAFDTAQDEAKDDIMEFFRIAPNALAGPGGPAVAAQFLRLLAQGNPIVEQMADSISPSDSGDMSPEQLGAQITQLKGQNQSFMQVIQKLQQAIQMKMPEIEADKWKTLMDNITKIRVAEISASKDSDNAKADREADLMTQLLQMAGDAASQNADHAQANQQQASDQLHQQSMPAVAAAAQPEPEPQGAAN